MAKELARTGVAGFERTDEAAVLVALLSLTSDAVLVFNEDGVVLLANEEAERLFRTLPGSLVESDVRLIFPPAATIADIKGPLSTSLPFALDGSTCTLTCEDAEHLPIRVRVRCERLAATAMPAYLLCAHAVAEEGGFQDENDRLVEELSRANKRLSGTLGIVLGTLDSLDIGTLFSRILGEITDTMDAWASVVYMAEQDGYRLRGATESLGDAAVPAFLPYDYAMAEMAAQVGRSLCVRVRPLTREELRRGEAPVREVIDEESGASVAVPVSLLPPFSHFVVVPVWFGGHMIALMLVGWNRAHRLRRDDARLLDAVAEYLSVQLAGAFAALRAQHVEHLESLGSTLRERLLSQTSLDRDVITSVFDEAAQGVDAMSVPLVSGAHRHTTIGSFQSLGPHEVPIDLSEMCRQHTLPYVSDVADVQGLMPWLHKAGEPSQGIIVLLGSFEGASTGFLLLRKQDEEPFQEVDISFVRRVGTDVLEVAAGERARNRDTRIAEALQRGMQNELQKVEGLSAQSCYSSATEAAYVGGDFYDLVRLPNRRACVIMGDVSGKGVEAASVSAAVKTALGAYAWEGLKPARMVELLNDFLLGFSRIETFATLFVGIVDLQAGELAYCSAGHPPALMVREATGELATLGVQSGVVGAFEGLRYRNGEVSLNKGDTLVLYTDGVTEARNPDGAFFGEDGLRDVVAQEAAKGFEGLCGRILEGVASFAGNSLEDDVALVVVRVDEVG